jgi:uncharacterized protein
MNEMNINTSALSTDAIQQAQQAFLTKVYAWMVAGLAITATVSWFTLDTYSVLEFIFNNNLFFPLFLGELALVWVLSANIHKFSQSTAMMLFVAYAVMNGLTLSVIFLYYTGESIMSVFSISAVSFAALSAYGYFTKRDLSGMRSFLFMGLIGIIVASVVNMFLQSSMWDFVISYAGVLVFAGLTAYDTQKIKNQYAVEFEGGEVAGKMAIMGALHLYLDFINLFLFLLRILGNRR